MRVLKNYIFALLLPAVFLTLNVNAEEQVIPLKKESGVYHIPVTVNGVLTLDFILDSGAAEVTIPADVVMTLVRTGTVGQEDFLDDKNYSMADGSVVNTPRIMLRSLKIGKFVFHNVPAGIGDVEGHLLLGQSLLEKLDAWTFDPKRKALIVSAKTGGNAFKIPNPLKDHLSFRPAEEANLKSPEGALEVFFQSIANSQFDVSWNTLSTYSKNKIIEMVANEEEGTKAEDIRSLFDKNHETIKSGFWTSFRDSSKIPGIVPYATYHAVKKKYGVAIVEVRVGSEKLEFNVVKEGPDWKVDLIGSIESNGDLSPE